MVSVATPVLGSVSAECAADLAEGSRWRAIAVFGSAAYLWCGHRHDAVVALVRPDALQLPNSVRIGSGDDLRELLQPGDEGVVRAGSLRIGSLDVRLAGRHRPLGVQVQPDHAVHPEDLAALDAVWSEAQVTFGPDPNAGCPVSRDLLARMDPGAPAARAAS